MYWMLLALIVLPRLVISFFGPRFYVLQALVPIVVWESLFNRKLFSLKRVALWLLASVVLLTYVMPALRGDEERGLEHAIAGSPVLLWPQWENAALLKDTSAPELIGCQLVGNTFFYDACGLRDKWGVPENVAPRIGQG